jgi:hypothetical protein
MHYYALLTAAHHAACDAACRYQRSQGHQMHADLHKAGADFGKAGLAGIAEVCAAVFALILLFRACLRRS